MNHLLPLFGILLDRIDAVYVLHFHLVRQVSSAEFKLNSINVFRIVTVLFCIRNKIDTTKLITHLPVGICSKMSLLRKLLLILVSLSVIYIMTLIMANIKLY
jgi:hypothetical protein